MNRKLKVHIVGTHGVPAAYGGFETLADFLCQYLNQDFDITVYCNANRYSQRLDYYFGANLKYIAIEANGFKGIFYDLVTYIKSLGKADVILYLSPVGSGFMTPLKYFTKTKIIVNHGGLNEWEREKLNKCQKIWAKFNHYMAATYSDVNIADNLPYKESLKNIFNAESIVIKYGGDHVSSIKKNDIRFFNKYPFVLNSKYAVSVSRSQIDNNIHVILEAFEKFSKYKIVLISNWNISEYGKKLKQKYNSHPNMILLDAIYEKEELDYIRNNAYLYIHSHSYCGTAPSLIEAMHLGLAVISYDVPTNHETTHNQAYFFDNSDTLITLLSNISDEQKNHIALNMKKIAQSEYSWKIIAEQYKGLINSLFNVSNTCTD
jgi:glycosyltransferase involved in cell wall biosynthesis